MHHRTPSPCETYERHTAQITSNAGGRCWRIGGPRGGGGPEAPIILYMDQLPSGRTPQHLADCGMWLGSDGCSQGTLCGEEHTFLMFLTHH